MSVEILYRYRQSGRTCYTPSLVVVHRRHNSADEDITYEISKPKKSSNKKKQINKKGVPQQ